MIGEVTVRSQIELDFAFAVIRQRCEGIYTVRIQSREDEWLSVREQPMNCHVEAYGSSHVEAYDSSHVEAYDSSHVEAYGSSHVKAYDSSHVKAYGSSHVEAYDSSHVKAYDSSHVEAYDSSHVKAYQYAIIRKVSKYTKIESAGAAIVVDSTNMVKHFTDARDWLAWWGVPAENGTAVLYKAVRPDFYDFYSGKIEYTIGSEVEAPDWTDPYGQECGHALHASPRIFQSDRYVQPKDHIHLKCQINVEDIRILPEMSMPDKCRVRKLKVLCQVGEYDDE